MSQGEGHPQIITGWVHAGNDSSAGLELAKTAQDGVIAMRDLAYPDAVMFTETGRVGQLVNDYQRGTFKELLSQATHPERRGG